MMSMLLMSFIAFATAQRSQVGQPGGSQWPLEPQKKKRAVGELSYQ
jgi:hypothetical protein